MVSDDGDEGLTAPAARTPIELWWIGERPADARLLERVRRDLAEQFLAVVTVRDPQERPRDTFDVRRHQHASRDVLRWLVEHAPAWPVRLLGLTDVDLFIPVLTFVFGEAQLGGSAAVVSVARLRHPSDPDLTAHRAARESVHELGHTFGLLHCSGLEGSGRRALPCVMSRSASVRAVDAKSSRLCADCRVRYRLLQQDGSHVYREHQNPHR